MVCCLGYVFDLMIEKLASWLLVSMLVFAGALGAVFYSVTQFDFGRAIVLRTFIFEGGGEEVAAPESALEGGGEAESKVLGDQDIRPSGYIGYPVVEIPRDPDSVFEQE